MINIDIDLNEISQEYADTLSTVLKIKGYIPSKAVVRTKQHLYQQTKYRRLFFVNSISTEMFENLRALSIYNSRTVNYSRDAAILELRETMVPLRQIYYFIMKNMQKWLPHQLMEDHHGLQ